MELVEDLPILGRNDENRVFQQFLSAYGAPAYIRRARQVEAAMRAVIERCRRQRDEWLANVRLRLGTLAALAGDWDRLRPFLADEDQIKLLRRLHEDLQPRLRMPVAVTSSSRMLLRSLHDLTAAIEHFNRRWQALLPTVDLSAVNALREGYNRYYVLEKECAVRSTRVARQGFQPLPPATVAEIECELPILPLPRLA